MTKSLLTIDCGNTHQTVALHENGKLKEVRHLIDSGDWMHFAGPAIISQVGPILPLPFQNVTNLKSLRNHQQLFEMPIHYSESLGDDRLALGYYAYQKLTDQEIESIVTIDAGTFTTVDLITSNGFQGGYIFPGPTTLQKSYHQGRQLSQHIKSVQPHDQAPQNSEEAISFAIELMMIDPILKIIQKWKPTKVLLCGGAHVLYLNAIKAIVPVEVVDNAIHLSLFHVAQKANMLD